MYFRLEMFKTLITPPKIKKSIYTNLFFENLISRDKIFKLER